MATLRVSSLASTDLRLIDVAGLLRSFGTGIMTCEALDGFAGDPSIRVVIVTGLPKHTILSNCTRPPMERLQSHRGDAAAALENAAVKLIEERIECFENH